MLTRKKSIKSRTRRARRQAVQIRDPRSRAVRRKIDAVRRWSGRPAARSRTTTRRVRADGGRPRCGSGAVPAACLLCRGPVPAATGRFQTLAGPSVLEADGAEEAAGPVDLEVGPLS